MLAKDVQFSPFPSFLNSSPVPLTTPSFSPHAAGGFQCKYTSVVTHKQIFLKNCKIWPVNASSRKALSQAVKCFAHELVFWIYCLNMHKTQHRANIQGESLKWHKLCFSIYLCRLSKKGSDRKSHTTRFSQVCQNIPSNTAFFLPGVQSVLSVFQGRRHLSHPSPLAG